VEPVLRRPRAASPLVPVYGYRCRLCSKEHDRHHGFEDTIVDLCDCGGELRKAFYLSGVTFKGGGFYRNDNQVNKPSEEE